MGRAYSDEQLARATRAVHRVTGGGIPCGKPRRRKGAAASVSAALVAEAALNAATRAEMVDPLAPHIKEGSDA